MARWIWRSDLGSVLAAVLTGCTGNADMYQHLCGSPSFSTFGLSSGGEGLSATGDAQGNFWFPEVERVDFANSSPMFKRLPDAIARVAPDQSVTEFDVEAPLAGGIAIDSDGNAWFTMSTGPSGVSSLGRLTPSGDLTMRPLSREACATPPCLDPPYDVMGRAMAAGPDGKVWFAEGNSRLATQGRITRIETLSEAVDRFQIASSSVSDMVAGPDGNVWLMGDFWTLQEAYIARATPDGDVTVFRLDGQIATERMTFGPDGNLWYTYHSTGSGDRELLLGRMNLQGETSTPIRLPHDLYPPHPIAAGRDGKLWIGAADKLICATEDGQIGTVAVPVPDDPRPDIPRPLICFGGMEGGSDGHLWLTTSSECFFAGLVVRVEIE